MQDQGSSFPRSQQQSSSFPWLLTPQGSYFETQIFYSVQKNRYYSKNIPELLRKRVLASSYGWLLLGDSFSATGFKETCYLYHPSSGKKIQLPLLKVEFQLKRSRCVFSNPQESKFDCHVLFISESEREIAFCKLGDNKFVVQSSIFGVDKLTAAAIFKGKIYGLLTPSHTLATIDFVGSAAIVHRIIDGYGSPFEIFPRPLPSIQRSQDFMIESSGEFLCLRKIYSPFLTKEVSEFQIFRIDLSAKLCKELDSLGERAIFLSNGTSWSVKPESNIVGNSIYFTEPGDKNLYNYEVEDKSKTILQACPNVESHWLGQWIMI